MKKWKCSVCGYVHIGDEPPDKCPVCGAPKSKFIEISEAQTPKPKPAPSTTPATESIAESPASPPLYKAEKPTIAEPVSPFAGSSYIKLFDMMTKYHAHPIFVHVPNGVLPIAVFFIFFGAIFGLESMVRVAAYNLGAVALTMPFVLYTGWVVWQHRFHGALTEVFIIKIACGIVVSVTSWVLFIWLLINPEVVTTSGAFSRVAFFMINFVMLLAATVAGWYGGKVVFKN